MGWKSILKNCNMTIPIGKIIGIIGENGSGKTTLLKTMAGILHPSSGTVSLDSNIKDRSQIIAYSPDNEYFYSYFSVQELINFYQSQYDDFQLEKAKDLLNFFQLDSNEKIQYLSKGQLGRVKITVTLAREAPILLLDEPLAGLDPMVKSKIIQGIIQFIDLNYQTVILTTHELLEIESLLDEVVIMKEGTIIDQKDVEEIREVNGQSVQEWLENNYSVQ